MLRVVDSPKLPKVRPTKLSIDHVSTFFTKGPELGIPNSKFNMYQCNTELLTKRKCSSIIKNKLFNGIAATAGCFKVACNHGFSNLYAHTQVCCPEWQDVWMNAKNEGALVPFVTCDSKSQNIYGWCDLVLSEKLPFS
jgi:hypothetical protein